MDAHTYALLVLVSWYIILDLIVSAGATVFFIRDVS